MRATKVNPWSQLDVAARGRSPPNVGAIGRKHYAGKPKALPKESQGNDRTNFSHGFIRQLEDSLKRRATELNQLWDCGAIPNKLAELIGGMFREACATVDATLQHDRAGAPPTLRRARALRKQLHEFEKGIDSELAPTNAKGLEVAFCVRDLCDDLEHYIKNITITYGIVPVSATGRVTAPNRQTNWEGKAAYAEIVYRHQLKYGPGTLPKPKDVINELTAMGHPVSPRTVRDWKNQLKSGQFGHYVQTRKRQ